MPDLEKQESISDVVTPEGTIAAGYDEPIHPEKFHPEFQVTWSGDDDVRKPLVPIIHHTTQPNR